MRLLTLFFLLLPFMLGAQHTFSIIAIDPDNGEIGSAGATCGDSIIWPGTPGAFIISDVLPGIGAIHTQSYYLASNQYNARQRMQQGDSPQEIIDWLATNDAELNPALRQYGIVDYNNGNPRSAAYTGLNCFDYKDHITGPNYSIQGNILLGPEILTAMEDGFNNTDGCLADKLMAAMQGANVVGADTRCTPEGTSSLSAFLRVAQVGDAPNNLYLDINIAATPDGVEPIDTLQTSYDAWRSNVNPVCETSGLFNAPKTEAIQVFPNPSQGLVQFELEGNKVDRVEVLNILGEVVFNFENIQTNQIDLSNQLKGLYFLNFYQKNELTAVEKIILD